MSRFEGFYLSWVPGMKLFGVSFQKPGQHQKLYPYPVKSCPCCHVSLILTSHIVLFSHGERIFTGFGLNLENQTGEKESFPSTHLCFMFPQNRDHNQMQSLGCEWDWRGQIHSYNLHYSVCGNIWYSCSFQTSCRIPLASLQEKLQVATFGGVFCFVLFCLKNFFFQLSPFGNGVKL